MSLRWRILRVLIIAIALTVAWNMTTSYYTIQRQFDAFVSGLGHAEASRLARQLSRAYTAAKGWDTVDMVLSASGFQYEFDTEHADMHGDENDEGFHIDQIRVVIADLDGRIIRDNFADLEIGDMSPTLSGQRREILDLRTGRAVGSVYLDVNQNFLETESSVFLRELLLNFSASAAFVLIIALALATSLSRRITAPISALTKATRAIAQRDDATLLPVTSNDELGQMSATFNQMTTALNRQRDLRRRLINDVSHELNTPLTVIQLEAKALLDDLQKPDRAAQHIIQEVNTLRNLVQDLSWLAETDSGELQLQSEPCAIDQLLIGEVERWQPQARARCISLSLRSPSRLPLLQLDRARISQALGNILHNALQHATNGQVIVAASMEQGTYIRISVQDDGVGIDPADLPHVFDRFFRADQSRSLGRGLGLDIARAIIEAHGGIVAVSSEGLGHGTTVAFSLPVPARNRPDSDPS